MLLRSTAPVTVSAEPTVASLVTEIESVIVASPVTVSKEPLKVRFPLSSSSPSVPAITTLLLVRSSTLTEEAVNPPPIVAPTPKTS